MQRFFIDYDCVTVDTICIDLRMITERLGKIAYRVFVTSPSHYHVEVVCNDTHFGDLHSLLKRTKCDKYYLEFAELKGAFFHRVGDKVLDGCVISGPPIEVII